MRSVKVEDIFKLTGLKVTFGFSIITKSVLPFVASALPSGNQEITHHLFILLQHKDFLTGKREWKE